MKELTNLTTVNDKKLLVVLPIKTINDIFLNEISFSISQQTQPIDVLVLCADNNSDENIARLKSILDKPIITIPEKETPDGPVTQKTIEATNKINYVVENIKSDANFQFIFNESLNYAIGNQYEFFSVIEPEDVLDSNWYNTVLKYASKKSAIDGFMPIMKEVSNGNFLGFFNEACWVDGYAEVAGTFDLQLLMRFNCVNITGAVFKTESLKTYGVEVTPGDFKVLKENFKLSFAYEFFLRMIYDDLKFFTIPRLGYEHRIDVPVSNIDPFSSKVPRNLSSWPEEKGGMTQEEIKFWNDSAKKEYFIARHDRKVEYKKREAVSVATPVPTMNVVQ